jgi:hypothetical protein
MRSSWACPGTVRTVRTVRTVDSRHGCRRCRARHASYVTSHKVFFGPLPGRNPTPVTGPAARAINEEAWRRPEV